MLLPYPQKYRYILEWATSNAAEKSDLLKSRKAVQRQRSSEQS